MRNIRAIADRRENKIIYAWLEKQQKGALMRTCMSFVFLLCLHAALCSLHTAGWNRRGVRMGHGMGVRRHGALARMRAPGALCTGPHRACGFRLCFPSKSLRGCCCLLFKATFRALCVLRLLRRLKSWSCFLDLVSLGLGLGLVVSDCFSSWAVVLVAPARLLLCGARS